MFERRRAMRGGAQFAMHGLHETVEMRALALLESQRLEEQIHQIGLAPADAAPKVDAARCRARRATPQSRRRPIGVEREGERIEALGGVALSIVEFEPAGGDLMREVRGNRLRFALHSRRTLSEALIVRTRAALGCHPGDLTRIGLFDVARLAMNAIRGVDLQFLT